MAAMAAIPQSEGQRKELHWVVEVPTVVMVQHQKTDTTLNMAVVEVATREGLAVVPFTEPVVAAEVVVMMGLEDNGAHILMLGEVRLVVTAHLPVPEVWEPVETLDAAQEAAVPEVKLAAWQGLMEP